MKRLQSIVVLGLGAAFALSACTREAAPGSEAPVEPVAVQDQTAAAPQIAYACESGATVNVRYPDTETAEITYRDQTYPMRVVISASGARYAGVNLEWWTASRGGQESGTLSRLGPNTDVGVEVLERCSRPAGDPLPSPPPPQPLQPINGVPGCLGPNLKMTREGGDAGAGNWVVVMSLQNVGSKPCYLNGYPKVALFNAQGAALNEVRSEETPLNYFSADQQPRPVTLAPQGKAFFDLAYSAIPHEDMGETVCPTATRIRATAPGDSAAILLDLEIEPCGQRLRVSPLRDAAEPPVEAAAASAA